MRRRRVVSCIACVLVALALALVPTRAGAQEADDAATPTSASVTLGNDALVAAVDASLAVQGIEHVTNRSARTIDVADVAAVTSLDLTDAHLTTLDGIAGFSELESLTITCNNVSDLAPLKGLSKLATLVANGNLVADVSPLASLASLAHLELATNDLADSEASAEGCITSKLSGLSNLTHLNLAHNVVRYTTGIGGLAKLGHLDLYDNAVHDLSGLADGTSTLLSLTHLDLGENNERGSATMAGLGALDGLAALTYLDFSENRTPDVLNHLAGMTKLEFLQLQGNGLSDLANLAGHTTLKTLILADNDIASIQPLLGLASLEELNLLNNKLAYTTAGSPDTNSLHGTVTTEGKPVWPHLKKLDLNRNFREGSTYQQPPELKTLYGLSATGASGALELGYDYRNVPGFDAASKVHTDADGTTYTTYDDFGARCDGSYDDYIAIYNAHVCASRNWNCEVRASTDPSVAATRTYHIFNPYNTSPAQLLGNVDWQGATLVVHDENIENKPGRYAHLFWSQQTLSPHYVTLTGDALASLNLKLTKSTTGIPELKPTLAALNATAAEYKRPPKREPAHYDRFLVTAVNAHKEQFIRSGSSGTGHGAAQQDSFIVREDGTLESEVQWDFDAITELRIVPIPSEEHFVRNATIVTRPAASGCEAPFSRPGKTMYYARGIYLVRCNNTRISNIVHGFAAGNDLSSPYGSISGSYQGILSLERCARVSLESCTLAAQRFNRPGRSTYDLTMSDCTDVTMRNVAQSNSILDTTRWAVMGDNYLKDVVLENCSLNDFDAHSGVHNLTVRDSRIGCKGIAVVGSGQLLVQNSTISSDRPIQLRGDYGSTWDGRVSLIGCTWQPLGAYRGRLIAIDFGFTGATGDGDLWNYGYDCHFPDVLVHDLVIDESLNATQSEHDVVPNGLWAFYSKEANVGKVPASYWPAYMVVNGVTFANGDRLAQAPRLHVTNSLLGTIKDAKGNYLVSNLHVTAGEEDATVRLLSGERVSTTGQVVVRADAAHNAAWSVEVWRLGAGSEQDQLVANGSPVSEPWEHVIREPGDYELRLSSTSGTHEWQGSRVLQLTIEGEPHEWSFTDFVWDDDEDGGRRAQARYVCRYGHDEHEQLVVATVEVSDRVEPTYRDEGSVTRTASVPASQSPDGEAHEERKTVSVARLVPLTVRVSGIAAADKTYDGTTSATLDLGRVVLDGVEQGDAPAIGATGTFESSSAGEGKVVRIEGLRFLNDCDGKYVLAAGGQQQSATASIAPATVTLAWTSRALPYVGTEQAPTATPVGILASDADAVSVVVSGQQSQVGGPYEATASLVGAAAANYALDAATQRVSFSIVAASAMLDMPAARADLVYDGTSQALAVPGSAAGGTLRYRVGDGAWDTAVPVAVDAGTYVVQWRLDADDREGVDVGELVVTLAPREVGLAWGETSFVYDGRPHAPTATATGLADGDACTVEVSGARTDAGSGYVATATHLSNGNYRLPANAATFAIAKAPLAGLAVSIEGWVQGGYDAQKNAPQVEGNAGGGEVAYAYRGAGESDDALAADVPTSAGSYVLRASVAETANYLEGVATCAFEVSAPHAGAVTRRDADGDARGSALLAGDDQQLAAAVPLRDDERARLAAGEDVVVWLEVADESAVSAADRLLVERSRGDYAVGAVLDLRMCKGVGDDVTQLTQLVTPVMIGLRMAELGLPSAPSGATRSYAVARVHDGVAELLEATEGDAGVLTFETDRFSTYAVLYRDVAGNPPAAGGPAEGGPAAGGPVLDDPVAGGPAAEGNDGPAPQPRVPGVQRDAKQREAARPLAATGDATSGAPWALGVALVALACGLSSRGWSRRGKFSMRAVARRRRE